MLNKIKFKFFLPYLLPFLSLYCLCYCSCYKEGRTDTDLYGNIAAEQYVIGKFNPSKHVSFISLSKIGIPTKKREHYLRKEAALALKRLYIDFHKQHPAVEFWVQSSTRDYYSQKYIWEGKWKELQKRIKNPVKRAQEILKYSSMPGTSRHHWGTDFDINILTNDYYNSGNGKILYSWLLKNAHEYGFCQPYNAGRKSGYYEERWHWSYYPLAKEFVRKWNKLYNSQQELFNKKGLFEGSLEVGNLASEYVNAINRNCM